MNARRPGIRVEQRDGTVMVFWPDGEHVRLHPLWLRDTCPCGACALPHSGQRLRDAMTIPTDIAIVAASLDSGGDLVVAWTDGHMGRFSPDMLRGGAHLDGSFSSTLWDAGVAQRLPWSQWEAVSTDDGELCTWLQRAAELGFALLHGVPPLPGACLDVVKVFGYVRETNYGRLFDVRTVTNPSNLAFTGLPLSPHTDNPYRDAPPTLQLLHCLSSDVAGGATTLVDGFRVAEHLRMSDPAAFELLSTVPLMFRYRDASTELVARGPVIACDTEGRVTGIRFNNRSRLISPDLPERLDRLYHALGAFSRLLDDPRYQIAFRLEPGDLVLMDNSRVLHGRTGYADTGRRHLQGCYADRDGLRSRLSVLRRGAICYD